eukprot:7518617-Alexandrium_andersonii.AAC.1
MAPVLSSCHMPLWQQSYARDQLKLPLPMISHRSTDPSSCHIERVALKLFSSSGLGSCRPGQELDTPMG